MSGTLVIGRTGQVAQALAHLGPDEGLTFLDRAALDLSRPETIAAAIAAHTPDLVINAAAYTAVDKAETESALAHTINATAVGEIAVAAARAGAPLIHLSTDYVYPGTRTGAHGEDDPTDPVNAYGASKLAGEHAALAGNPRTVILRTAWVYAPWGANFVLTMLRLADRARLTVVADQQGQPTSALDIARACLAIGPRLRSADADAPLWGVYHFAGAGPTTWAEFAVEVFAQAHAAGMLETVPEVAPIPTTDYPTPAKRPANSTLDCTRFERTFDHPMTPWRTALAEVLAHRMRSAG
jgi:dTDP-4-dehydrorhamnose reductase